MYQLLLYQVMCENYFQANADMKAFLRSCGLPDDGDATN